MVRSLLIGTWILVLLPAALISFKSEHSLSYGQLNPLFSRQLAQTFNEIEFPTKSRNLIVFSSWGLYFPAELDSSFHLNNKSKNSIDGWPWFSGAPSVKSRTFFKWNISFGPMSGYGSYTFVSYDSKDEHTLEKMKSYVKDVMQLCDVHVESLPITGSNASLNAINAKRC